MEVKKMIDNITCGYSDGRGMCEIGQYKIPHTAEHAACTAETATIRQLRINAIENCTKRNGYQLRINGLEKTE